MLSSSPESYYANALHIWEWILLTCGDKLSSDTSDTSSSEIIVSQALIYIKENYSRKIRAEDVATSLNISYRTLARHFVNTTGITIIQQINDVRMTHAKDMLLNTNMSVKDIAEQCGFSNEYYFSSIFKKKCDLSPLRFRKDYLNKNPSKNK